MTTDQEHSHAEDQTFACLQFKNKLEPRYDSISKTNNVFKEVLESAMG